MTLVDEVRGLQTKVLDRLQELQPLVEEYHELQKLAESLGLQTPTAKTAAKPTASTAKASPKRSPRKRAARRSSSRGTRPSTRSVGVEREQEVLELITSSPGVTVAEIGEKLSVERTGLYRVVRRLEKSGAVVKEGTTLRPAETRTS